MKCKAAACQAFDPECGPLLRAHLFRLGPDDHVLMLLAHHIVVGGWSMGIIRDEPGRAFASFSAGRRPNMQMSEAEHDADFPGRESLDQDYCQQLSQDYCQQLRDYWTDQLRGLPPVNEFVTDRRRPPLPTMQGSHLRTLVRRKLFVRLANQAESLGVTNFVLLLTAFVVLVHRWVGQEEVAIGVPATGRTSGGLMSWVHVWRNAGRSGWSDGRCGGEGISGHGGIRAPGPAGGAAGPGR